MGYLKKLKKDIAKTIRLLKSLKKDKRVPRVSKIVLVVATAYLVSPLDLIPDFIPILGAIDDFILIPLLLFLAVAFIPKGVFKENYKKVFRD